MSMSTQAALDACTAAGIEPPSSVLEFFGYEEPDPAGVLIDLAAQESSHWTDPGHPRFAARPWADESSSGYEVDIRELPKDVQIIRFVNSY